MLFYMDDDSLTVTFQGIEQFWAAKRKLVVPKTDIVRANWQENMLIPRAELGWRIGGSAIPGVLVAGRFWGNQGKNFVYLQRPSRENGGILQFPSKPDASVGFQHVLELELRNQPYKHFFFTLDKPDLAQRLVAWWSES